MKCLYCKHYETEEKGFMIDHIAAEHPKEYHRYHRGRENYGLQWVQTKPAEPTDDPGELMAAMMPLLKHMPVPEIVKDKVSCPVCGQACQARPEMLRQAAKIYGGRMIPVCSECSLTAHTRKPALVLWLREQGKTPDQVLAEVLAQAEGGGQAK